MRERLTIYQCPSCGWYAMRGGVCDGSLRSGLHKQEIMRGIRLVAEADVYALLDAIQGREGAEAFLRFYEPGRPDARTWGHVASALRSMVESLDDLDASGDKHEAPGLGDFRQQQEER